MLYEIIRNLLKYLKRNNMKVKYEYIYASLITIIGLYEMYYSINEYNDYSMILRIIGLLMTIFGVRYYKRIDN